MKTIKKLVLKNFKRFRDLKLDFDSELNILVGGNEAGKSSVLQALDIVMSAGWSKVESLGLEMLFNQECIDEFLAGGRDIANLPEMFIEIDIDGLTNHHAFDGRINSSRTDRVGMRLICKPDDEYSAEIKAILDERHDSFPFEYYKVQFETFGGDVLFFAQQTNSTHID